MGNSAMNYQKENGFVEFGCGKNYHMDFAALQNFMPEKAELVQKVFELESESFFSKPHPHSIPVYDVELGRIFFALTLDRCNSRDNSVRTYISIAVRKSMDEGIGLKCPYASDEGYFDVEGHHFIAVEDVPLKILRIAFEKQKDDGIVGRAEKAIKEHYSMKDFCKASSELDKALKEAKELLK